MTRLGGKTLSENTDLDDVQDLNELDLKKLPITVTPGQTVINIPDAPSALNLYIDGVLQEETKTAYTYNAGSGIITVSEPFLGGEDVEVQYGQIVPVTAIVIDGIAQFSSVAQMVASPDLNVNDKVITYTFNAAVLCNWIIVASGAGDLSDKTLLLNNGLYASLQEEPMMSVRCLGAFGDDTNDDSDAWINAVNNFSYVVGNEGDNYVVTKHIKIPSNTTIHRRGSVVKWRGVADPIDVVGRDRGVFEIKGTLGDVLDTSIVFTQWLEGAEIYPTNDSSLIVDEKYLVVSAGTPPEAHVGYLLRPKVSPSNPSTRIQLDYVLGWNLADVQWTYKEVAVIENVTIEDMEIIDETDPDGSSTDVSGIIMQFAANCHVKNLRTTNVYFPSVFAHFATDCSVDGCYIEPATNTEPSGFGIVVQWNNCYRCNSINLQGRGVRRISDFTACAHCTVIDSGGENTRDGEFTTHGEFEHNLYYRNTRGIMSFANSGPIFGETSKNIVVEQHRGSTINASNNVYNLSLKDCLCNFYNLNSVGLVVDNCNLFTDGVTPKNFQINNYTRANGFAVTTTKPTVVKNSEIEASFPAFIVDQDINAEDSVHFINCKIKLKAGDFAGQARIKMTDCDIGGGVLVLVANPTKVELVNCDMNDIAFGVLAALTAVTGAVDFKVDGGTITGSDSFDSAFFAMRDTSQIGLKCRMVITNDVVIKWAFENIFESPSATRNPLWYQRISNSEIINTGVGAGNVVFSSQQSPLHIGGNTLENVTLDLGTLGGTRIKYNNVEI